MTTTAERPTSATALRPLEGRVALVTGSSSGIGLGIAKALGAQGASLVLNGIEEEAKVAGIRDGVAKDYGVPVAYEGADLSKPEVIEAMVERVVKRFGRVDIVVNNAGIQFVSPIEDFPTARWDLIIALNLTAAFHTTRLTIKGMKERGWGRIINIASAHGLVASPFKSAYVAAKHGIVGFTKVTALEAAENGVTCNAICPGYVFTPLVEKQIDDQAKAHGISRDRVIREVLLAQQPNKKFATVEEMGALAAFLCSEGAASITGTAIPADGGWTAH